MNTGLFVCVVCMPRAVRVCLLLGSDVCADQRRRDVLTSDSGGGTHQLTKRAA